MSKSTVEQPVPVERVVGPPDSAELTSMDILEALARGEIGVDEAMAQLDALAGEPGPGHG